MAFLRNTWYVAAWGSEIEVQQLFSRTLLNERILFFRDTVGRIQAIKDRCPHRFAPLSLGRHCGDAAAVRARRLLDKLIATEQATGERPHSGATA
ncbi:hypothetical protein GCM10011348_03790 [Marinobacterium nitratireducens]|uniref:Rieske domain-containing protein n=1 Tax=Marinobacterium nitratireducens TaxID=518897 RepID=A0A917Z6B0_9GAMM|nr:Rieske 2Fe-2S domain-containing protein [Marinobacterium nitratireducens]GGO76480.1 hypothetical protein GCM10011348_03790 [Marinobacterium nitratireducens]